MKYITPKTIYLAASIMSFGKWLRANRKAAGLTQDQLAVKVSAHGVNTSAGYISNLEREYYKTQFNEPSRPNERLVDTIATVLGKPINEARLAAGYAPTTALRKPTTIPELVEALEAIGIEMPQLSGGFPPDVDGEEAAKARTKRAEGLSLPLLSSLSLSWISNREGVGFFLLASISQSQSAYPK